MKNAVLLTVVSCVVWSAIYFTHNFCTERILIDTAKSKADLPHVNGQYIDDSFDLWGSRIILHVKAENNVFCVQSISRGPDGVLETEDDIRSPKIPLNN